MPSKRIKLKEGLVNLSGFSAEIGREMEDYILKFTPKGLQTIKLAPVETDTSLSTKTFPDKAIGMKKVGDKYEVVVVGYDKDTKEASVEEIKPAGDFQAHAMSVFQQEVMKKGLI